MQTASRETSSTARQHQETKLNLNTLGVASERANERAGDRASRGASEGGGGGRRATNDSHHPESRARGRSDRELAISGNHAARFHRCLRACMRSRMYLHGEVIYWQNTIFFRKNTIRCSIVVSISACYAEDPGSIPSGGASASSLKLLRGSNQRRHKMRNSIVKGVDSE